MQKVAVLVVTYNRRALLRQNLLALLAQDYRDFDLFVLDNHSTDGTRAFVADLIDANGIHYIYTEKNLGGAGGFSLGLQTVAASGRYEYCWLMDDDTIPTPGALGSLMQKQALVPDAPFLSSLTKWTDGSICRMNVQLPDADFLSRVEPLAHKLIAIRVASFVACLVRMEDVYRRGLPIKEFFIYGDDVEYTWRLSRETPGYLDVDSVVVHHMGANTPCSVLDCEEARIDRYYYDARNRLVWLRGQGCGVYLHAILHNLSVSVRALFTAKSRRWKRCFTYLKGTVFGIFFRPRIEYVARPSDVS